MQTGERPSPDSTSTLNLNVAVGDIKGSNNESILDYTEFLKTIEQLHKASKNIVSIVSTDDIASCLEIIAQIFSGRMSDTAALVHQNETLAIALWSLAVEGTQKIVNEVVTKKLALEKVQEKKLYDLHVSLSSIVNLVAEDFKSIPNENYAATITQFNNFWNNGSLDSFGSTQYNILKAITAHRHRLQHLVENDVVSVRKLVKRARLYPFDSLFFGMISNSIANMCQIPSVATELITGCFEDEEDVVLIEHLMPGITTNNSNSVSSIFVNLTINKESHSLFLDKNKDLLTHCVIPIVVVENATYSEEEKLELPTGIYGLICDNPTKKPDPNDQTRSNAIACVYQLCSRREYRESLREQNIYCLLREYHKYETNEELLDLTEQVVNILIQTEDEIGVDDLKELSLDDKQ